MDVFLPLFACACYFTCLRVFFFFLLICSDFSWVTSIVVSVTANNSCISICWNDSQGSFWCDTWMEWVLKNSLGKSFQPYTFSGLLTDFQILIILAPSLLCNSFLFDSPIVPEWFIILFYLAILCSDLYVLSIARCRLFSSLALWYLVSWNNLQTC